MPRNQDPSSTKKKATKKQTEELIQQAMQDSKTITEQATKKAVAALLSSITLDQSEGSASQPRIYSEIFGNNLPENIQPQSIFLQTPLDKQQLSKNQGTPAKRLTLMEGSATELP